jgi:hypothetical protein
MRLFIYLSQNRERAVILFRKTKNTTLQILWDIKAGTFQEGEWLTRKSIYYNGCRLSPDGSLFTYQYSDTDGDHIGVSSPPYFTAKIYGKPTGRRCKSLFTRDNIPVFDRWVDLIRNEIFCIRLPEYKTLPKSVKINDRDFHISDTGLEEGEECEDYLGRCITTDGGTLLVWGEEPKSFVDAEFTRRVQE